MLRSVLEGYLAGVKEREFDLPLLHLLPLLGYYDIHFTHGPFEFGKDIIAKKQEAAEEIQCIVQSKAGNITPTQWRNEVRGQVLTALWSDFSHPTFNKDLPRRAIVVTTGEYRHSAATETQEFRSKVPEQNAKWSVEFWDKSDLIEHLLVHGLEGVYRATTAGILDFDRFLVRYAHALRGDITCSEIEAQSRRWSDLEVDVDHQLLICSIESEILAQQCLSHDLVYEAAHCHLARLRLLCELTYRDGEHELHDLWNRAVEALYVLCRSYVDRIRAVWIPKRDLASIWKSDLSLVTYPVQCLRILELATIAYFTARDDGDRGNLSSFIREFVAAEPGCTRPPGDRHALSLVLTVLALLKENALDLAELLILSSACWVCDRYEKGLGLAEIEANEQSETNRLLTLPFVLERRQSFLATALVDLAAFIGDAELYADVVNDFKYLGIVPEYWQMPDSVGACRYEAGDVIQYSSVRFRDTLPNGCQNYGSHQEHERTEFRFVEQFGEESAIGIMSLLRDRYFPGLWSRLAPVTPK